LTDFFHSRSQLFTSSTTQITYVSALPAPAPVPLELSFQCGHSIALSNEYAVIGCPGFRTFDNGAYSENKNGAVVIYDRTSNPNTNPPRQIIGVVAAELGISVSVNAKGIVAVGAKGGNVALYDLTQPTPTEIKVLGNSVDLTTSQDNFGWSVALNDDNPPMLAVGAIKQDGSGSVFLWSNVNTDMVEDDYQEISAPTAAKANCDTAKGCQFGFSVALFDQTLVVGSPGTESKRGTAFVYNNVTENSFEANAQSLLEFIPPPNALFGQSVAITNGAVVVGSPGVGV